MQKWITARRKYFILAESQYCGPLDQTYIKTGRLHRKVCLNTVRLLYSKPVSKDN